MGFQFLIGTLKTEAREVANDLPTLVSIPDRYAKNYPFSVGC